MRGGVSDTILYYNGAMDQLPRYSVKRFRGAIGDALRARRGDDMGNYNKSDFARELAGQSQWSENTILGYLKGARKPTPAALEAMAALLDLPAGADYFLEYRVHRIKEAMIAHPELTEECYRLLLSHLDLEAEKDGPSVSRRKSAT